MASAMERAGLLAAILTNYNDFVISKNNKSNVVFFTKMLAGVRIVIYTFCQPA
jgi:hypothetical protein